MRTWSVRQQTPQGDFQFALLSPQKFVALVIIFGLRICLINEDWGEPTQVSSALLEASSLRNKIQPGAEGSSFQEGSHFPGRSRESSMAGPSSPVEWPRFCSPTVMTMLGAARGRACQCKQKYLPPWKGKWIFCLKDGNVFPSLMNMKVPI